MSRFKAGGIHLLISLCIAALVAALIYFLWFPPPYFKVTGGSDLIVLIMSVDIVIGPLLTFAVFKSGKKSLRFDLAVIALLQASAFCYGFWVIANSRPVFVVARLDRFIAVSANQLEDADLAEAKDPAFAHRSWTGPRVVGAVLPTDHKQAQDLLFSGLAGKDLERFPKYYVPYDAVADNMLAKAKPLAELAKKNPANAAIIERYAASSGTPVDQYVYLPLQGHIDGYTMVIQQRTKQPVAALPIDPW